MSLNQPEIKTSKYVLSVSTIDRLLLQNPGKYFIICFEYEKSTSFLKRVYILIKGAQPFT